MTMSSNKNMPSLSPIRGPSIPITDSLITRFIDHAQITPTKIAIMTTEQSLTYQQLYQEVLFWKTTLFLQATAQEKKQEQIYILCLERGPLMLALLLAMQWLDITYIPVDPDIPLNRLHNIIQDSKAQRLICDVGKHSHFSQVSCTLLDVTQVKTTSIPSKREQSYLPKQSGTAYIIYTSGSTGKPKGVAISRLSLHNFLTSMSTFFLQEPDDLVLATTTISFDISVLELYLPIWQQKTVFIANQAQHKDPISIVDILKNYPITLLQATPSFWNTLLNLEWDSKTTLTALCGGESLTPTLAQRLSTKCLLWNLYGPTEATVWCSLKQILPNSPITIGRPIHNTEMRVMDAEMRILPAYEQGELYIGGIGLAEGYVNSSDLNKSKFFSYDDALLGRLYRVGDLACTTENGEFIIFGRTDNQIKLHGFRIELEEIETHVQAFPNISECAARTYLEQLIVYICIKPHASFVESQLIQHLAQYVPQYMLPKRIILMDQLPKTISGKIDRNSLPSPTISTIPIPDSQLSPQQVILSQIWAEALSLETIGLHNNFFELGGHSLSAARISAHILKKLGKKITINDLLQAPTIEQFEKLVDRAPLEQTIPLMVTKPSNPLAMHEIQLTYWLSTLDPKIRNPNVAGRKRVRGLIDKPALDLSLQLVLQKQGVFSYHVHHFYPLLTLCKQPLKRHRQWLETSLVHLQDDEIESYLNQKYEELYYHQTWRVNRPLISVHLYYLKQEQVEFHVCMSHLIADEQAISVFFQEFSKAYLFFTQHANINIHDTLNIYPNYVLQQNVITQRYAASDEQFWITYLKDAGLLSIPKQYLANKPDRFPIHLPLPKSFISKLQQFCLTYQIGINDVLSAAVSLALVQCLDIFSNIAPHKVMMASLKSTRDQPQYDDTIGLFLRMDIIKMDLNGKPTLLNLARQAQRSTGETALYQRATTLVKLAGAGIKSPRTRPVLRFFLEIALKKITQYFPKLELTPSFINAFNTLATMDRSSNPFIIFVNILNNFLVDKPSPSQADFLGLPKQNIPLQPGPLQVIDGTLGVVFHRSNDQNMPFLTLGCNLKPEFQTKIGKAIISIIEHS